MNEMNVLFSFKEVFTMLYEIYCRENNWSPLNSRGFYKNLRGKGFRDYQAADHNRYFKDMCCATTDNPFATTGFVPATDEDSAVFMRKGD